MAIKPILDAVDAAKTEIENLNVERLSKELQGDADILLADIRELQERVDLGTIPGAKHVPRGMLEFWADPASPYFRDWFQQDRRTILFCAGGGRSALAAKALQDMGFYRRGAPGAGLRGLAGVRRADRRHRQHEPLGASRQGEVAALRLALP